MSSIILYNAYDTSIERLMGGICMGAAILLTLHSLFHMAVLRSTVSKYYLFPIVNILLLLSEILILIKLVAPDMRIWTTITCNGVFTILKPAILYLAFLRCKAVYSPFRNNSWIHYLLIALGALQLTSVFFADIQYSQSCRIQNEGCTFHTIIHRINDWFSPLFRFYYIILEGVFLVVFFNTFHRSNLSESTQLIHQRRFQTFLFCLDLLFLTFTSVYHVICTFKSLPTYEAPELFSIAFTVFCMTEFGLTIPKLFRNVRTNEIELRNRPASKSHSTSTADELASNIDEMLYGGKGFGSVSSNGNKETDFERLDEDGVTTKVGSRIDKQGSVGEHYNTNNTSFVSSSSQHDLATRDVSSMRHELFI